MEKKIKVYIVVASSIILTCLFHRQNLGLNLFVFESLILIWFIASKQIGYNTLNQITCIAGLFVTSLATVITHSTFSYLINFFTVFVFIGILIYPTVKSLICAVGLSFTNLFQSQIHFILEFSNSKFQGQKIGNYIRKSRIFIIPFIIIVIFIGIYRKSNPIFDRLVINIFESISEIWNYIIKDFDFLIILTLLISLSISVILFLRTTNPNIIKYDLTSRDQLIRLKKKSNRIFRTLALKNEYRAGVFLLLILNFIILFLNAIDIHWVWFNFEWEGQYLKQFVHEGTYLLILSIIISIALVLYFFRGNLNFYFKNTFFKYLSYIWLAQNGLLTISVAIRNFWYIHYFSLAYKRIGVIIFLILTLYGLYTVFVKVRHRKSSSFLFKSNVYSLLVVLIVSSIINWDSVIARYNFNNSNKSFLHLDYLSTLSDKSLPYLDKSLSELEKIEIMQKEKFPFEQKFMSAKEFHKLIEDRKLLFKAKWESKNILSWNLPEYLAYRKLYLKDTNSLSD